MDEPDIRETGDATRPASGARGSSDGSVGGAGAAAGEGSTEAADGGDGYETPRVRAERRLGLARFLLLEGVVVVLGVLIALGVDEWREETERAEAVEAARAGVVQEVERNLEELVRTDSIVSSRLDRLEALIDGDEVSDRSLAQMSFGGFWVPELGGAAWERLSTGVLGDHVDPTFTGDAFALYRRLEELDRLSGHVTDLTFSRSFFDPADAALNALLGREIMTHQVAWARTLVRRHCDFLATHGSGRPEGCPAPGG